jgi:hypothetical protein
MNIARKLILGTLMASGFSVAAMSEAFAQDRHVTVINISSQEMVSFYASRSNLGIWQEDIFGRRVLDSGYHVRVNVDDGSGACLYDFKAVMASGAVTTRYRVNVCTTDSWTVYDAGRGDDY